MRGVAMLVAGSMLLGGCVGGRSFDSQAVTAAQVRTELPAPTLADQFAAQQEYRIGPLDKLQIAVFNAAELSQTSQVDLQGNFTMPLIGAVRAAGETPTEFARKLEGLLGARYLTNPQVTVTVTEAVSQQVTIEGSVTRPGRYPLTGRTSLVQVVAVAGGTTEFAREKEVLVFRNVSGSRLVARFNLDDIRVGRAPDPEVYGNDIVLVADDKNRRIFRDVVQSAPLLGIFYQFSR